MKRRKKNLQFKKTEQTPNLSERGAVAAGLTRKRCACRTFSFRCAGGTAAASCALCKWAWGWTGEGSAESRDEAMTSSEAVRLTTRSATWRRGR